MIIVAQAAKRFCQGKTKRYEMITYESLPVVRFGRAVRIDPMEAWEWLDQRKKKQQS